MNLSFKFAIVSAVGFITMAIFNYVQAWPLLFPLIGGLAAMASNKSATHYKGYGTILLYGFYATLLVMLIAMPLMWFKAKDAILQQVNEMGYKGSGASFAEVASIIILSMGVLFFVAYLVGTAFGAIFPSKKYRE